MKTPFREEYKVYLFLGGMLNQVTHDIKGIEFRYEDGSFYRAKFESIESGDYSLSNIDLDKLPRPHEIVSCGQWGELIK